MNASAQLVDAAPGAIALANAVADDVPAVLLRYQAEAVTLSHENELFVCEKSRRTGITYGFAADAVLIASPALRPQNVYYIAFNFDMTREFIDYVGMFAKAFEGLSIDAAEFLFDDGSEKGIKALRVDFPSGKSVVALSSKPRSLRGRQGVVIIDEAAFHDDLKGVIDAANALTMWGGRIVVISTHNGTTNYFNQLITEIRAGRREGYVYRLPLKEALEDGLYKRICLVQGIDWSEEGQTEWERGLRGRTPDAAAQEYDVIPAEGSGFYLTRALIEASTTDQYVVLRLTCPKGFERQHPDPKVNAALRAGFVAEWLDTYVKPLLKAKFDRSRPSFFGQDFARNGDLSVVAPGQHDDFANLHVPFIVEMRNVPFREQKQLLDYLVNGMPNFNNGKMDARGNGQNLAEDMQSDHGFDRIEAVMTGPKVYLERMPRLKARFEDQTILMPRDEGIISDHLLIQLVNGVPQIVDHANDDEAGGSGKRHGDSAIALMNLVSAADTYVAPIDIHRPPNPRGSAAEVVTTNRGFGTVRRRERGL